MLCRHLTNIKLPSGKEPIPCNFEEQIFFITDMGSSYYDSSTVLIKPHQEKKKIKKRGKNGFMTCHYGF